MRRLAFRGPRMSVFTDLDAAIEEAEYLASMPVTRVKSKVPRRVRLPAYLVQFGNTIRVQQSKPARLPVMMVVRPKSKLMVKFK